MSAQSQHGQSAPSYDELIKSRVDTCTPKKDASNNAHLEVYPGPKTARKGNDSDDSRLLAQDKKKPVKELSSEQKIKQADTELADKWNTVRKDRGANPDSISDYMQALNKCVDARLEKLNKEDPELQEFAKGTASKVFTKEGLAQKLLVLESTDTSVLPREITRAMAICKSTGQIPNQTAAEKAFVLDLRSQARGKLTADESKARQQSVYDSLKGYFLDPKTHQLAKPTAEQTKELVNQLHTNESGLNALRISFMTAYSDPHITKDVSQIAKREDDDDKDVSGHPLGQTLTTLAGLSAAERLLSKSVNALRRNFRGGQSQSPKNEERSDEAHPTDADAKSKSLVNTHGEMPENSQTGEEGEAIFRSLQLDFFGGEDYTETIDRVIKEGPTKAAALIMNFTVRNALTECGSDISVQNFMVHFAENMGRNSRYLNAHNSIRGSEYEVAWKAEISPFTTESLKGAPKNCSLTELLNYTGYNFDAEEQTLTRTAPARGQERAPGPSGKSTDASDPIQQELDRIERKRNILGSHIWHSTLEDPLCYEYSEQNKERYLNHIDQVIDSLSGEPESRIILERYRDAYNADRSNTPPADFILSQRHPFHKLEKWLVDKADGQVRMKANAADSTMVPNKVTVTVPDIQATMRDILAMEKGATKPALSPVEIRHLEHFVDDFPAAVLQSRDLLHLGHHPEIEDEATRKNSDHLAIKGLARRSLWQAIVEDRFKGPALRKHAATIERTRASEQGTETVDPLAATHNAPADHAPLTQSRETSSSSQGDANDFELAALDQEPRISYAIEAIDLAENRGATVASATLIDFTVQKALDNCHSDMRVSDFSRQFATSVNKINAALIEQPGFVGSELQKAWDRGISKFTADFQSGANKPWMYIDRDYLLLDASKGEFQISIQAFISSDGKRLPELLSRAGYTLDTNFNTIERILSPDEQTASVHSPLESAVLDETKGGDTRSETVPLSGHEVPEPVWKIAITDSGKTIIYRDGKEIAHDLPDSVQLCEMGIEYLREQLKLTPDNEELKERLQSAENEYFVMTNLHHDSIDTCDRVLQSPHTRAAAELMQREIARLHAQGELSGHSSGAREATSRLAIASSLFKDYVLRSKVLELMLKALVGK